MDVSGELENARARVLLFSKSSDGWIVSTRETEETRLRVSKTRDYRYTFVGGSVSPAHESERERREREREIKWESAREGRQLWEIVSL